MASLADYVNQLFPVAYTASVNTGLPVNYILAQSAYETGGFTSYSANTRNNYFGISPGGQQAWYSSPADSFNAFANLMNSGRYAGATQFGDPYSIASYVNDKGYSTTPTNVYASGVKSWYDKISKILDPNGELQNNGSGAGSSAVTDLLKGVVPSSSPSKPTQDTVSVSTDTAGWIERTLSRFGVILAAIVVLGVGLWMLAKR